MRTVHDEAPAAPAAVAPIHLEFYGSDDAAGTAARQAGLPRPWEISPEDGDRPPGSGLGAAVAALAAVGLVIVAVTVGLRAAAADRDAGDVAPRTALSGDEAVVSPPPPPPPSAPGTLPPVHANPLPFPGGSIDPGRYSTDLLGLPVEFTVADETALRTSRPGTVLLSPVGSSVSTLVDAPHVQFLRLGGWNSVEQSVDRTFQGVGDIPPHDVDAWIADSDVIVDRRTRTTIDGRPTQVLDLRVDPKSERGDGVCVPDLQPCFWYASVAAEDILLAPIRLDHPLSATMTIRLWLIEIGGADPLLVEAAAVAGEEATLDRFAATTMATLDIGPSAVELLTGSGSGVPAPR